MKPLIVLIIVFAISCIVGRITTGSWQLIFSGNLAMCIMLFFTAVGHFIFTDGMTMMIPKVVPLKKELVYLSGILEIIVGIALLIPAVRPYAGIALLVLLIVMLPANISAAIRHIDYETATNNGKGLEYLWFRVPMQIFLLIWTFYFAIKFHH